MGTIFPRLTILGAYLKIVLRRRVLFERGAYSKIHRTDNIFKLLYIVIRRKYIYTTVVGNPETFLYIPDIYNVFIFIFALKVTAASF